MDPFVLKYITCIVFVLTYLFICFYYNWKHYIIWSGAVILFFAGSWSLQSLASVDWNVIGLYLGMLFVAQALVESRFADFIAEKIVSKTRSARIAMLAVCAMSGIISIVIENVACVLIVAPIAFALAKRTNISPVPVLIGTALCANLEGNATLIGDPPSMLLASHAGFSFGNFFVFDGSPGLFFAVQLGLLCGLAVLFLFFPAKISHSNNHGQVRIISYVPLLILAALIILLSPLGFGLPTGVVSLSLGFLSLAWLFLHHTKREKRLWHVVRKMDYSTAVFIVGVFVLVSALLHTGVLSDIAMVIAYLSQGSLLGAFLVIILVSLLLSAFIDNIPYIVAMLPVVQIVAERFNHDPSVLYFGLLLATTIGGNITPIGASANIVAVGALRTKGYKVSFWDFVKIGLPFTIASLASSAFFVWIFFGS